MRRLFVTGIGTDVGKTVVSAILAQKLQADYWKPIQAGDLSNTDSMKVSQWVDTAISTIHPEVYRLTQPMSPHAAAERDGLCIDLLSMNLPKTDKNLIIEGAGGLMVPLSQDELVIDLIAHFQAEVILVSRHYLGSINHTILSIEALRARNIRITGIIFNGDENKDTESIIESMCAVPILGRIPQIGDLNKSSINNITKLINI
ncbi:MAG: dethiobiotin synthase [Candidatus Marinimicrobia bacterium]|nr:dethiobiotin synthase [Candidatus Neomarinimicrobiota bacterium]